MKDYQQGGTTVPIPLFFVSAGDHTTGHAGGTVTLLVSKGTAAFAAHNGTVSEVGGLGNGYGHYHFLPGTADVNTAGPIRIHATINSGSADPFDDLYWVVPWNPLSTDLGLTGFGTVTLGTAGLSSVVLPDVANDTAARANAGGMLRAIYNRFFNPVSQTSTQQTVQNDGGTVFATMALSTGGGTAIKGKSS